MKQRYLKQKTLSNAEQQFYRRKNHYLTQDFTIQRETTLFDTKEQYSRHLTWKDAIQRKITRINAEKHFLTQDITIQREKHAKFFSVIKLFLYFSTWINAFHWKNTPINAN